MGKINIQYTAYCRFKLIGFLYIVKVIKKKRLVLANNVFYLQLYFHVINDAVVLVT